MQLSITLFVALALLLAPPSSAFTVGESSHISLPSRSLLPTTNHHIMSSAAVEDDPFGAFGEDDDDDDSGDQDIIRDAENGVLAFRDGTEQALLSFVRNGLDNASRARGGDEDKDNEKATTIQRRLRILNLVDEFCRSRHWMMHVGDEKGPIMQDFLVSALKNATTKSSSNPFVVVEIGTYCGYSLTRMANTIEKHHGKENYHIITVDVNPKNVAVAKELIKLGGLEDCVSFLLLQDPPAHGELPNLVRKTLTQLGRSSADFVFIDHAKEAYLSDLLQLEAAGLIKAGAHVCADNVVFFKLEDYRSHVKSLADNGIVETRLEMSSLEYCLEHRNHEEAPGADLQDGLGIRLDVNELATPPRRGHLTHTSYVAFSQNSRSISRIHQDKDKNYSLYCYRYSL